MMFNVITSMPFSHFDKQNTYWSSGCCVTRMTLLQNNHSYEQHRPVHRLFTRDSEYLATGCEWVSEGSHSPLWGGVMAISGYHAWKYFENETSVATF